MASKFTGVIGESFAGDREKAVSYRGQAKLLCWQLEAKIKAPPFNGVGQQYGSRRMPDGSVIHAMVQMLGAWPIVRTWIESPLSSGEKYETLMPLDTGHFLLHPRDKHHTICSSVLLEITSANNATNTNYTIDPPQRSACVNWCGVINGKQEVVSWNHGLLSRYRIYPHQTCAGRPITDYFGSYADNNGYPGLWIGGDKIDTLYTDLADGTSFVFNVVGAAKFRGLPVAVSHLDTTYRGGTDEGRFESNSKTVSVFYYAEYWRLAGRFPVDHYLHAPWFFSPDGSQATSVVDQTIGNKLVAQSRYNIELSYEEVDGAPKVSCVLNAYPLDLIQQLLKVDPPELQSTNTIFTPSGVQPPGEFSYRISGSVQYRDSNGDWQTAGREMYANDTSGAVDMANELAALQDPAYGLISVTDNTDSYLVTLANLDTYTNRYSSLACMLWKPGFYPTGQVFIDARRNTEYCIEDAQYETVTTMPASGKRYFAVDYNANGAVLFGSIQLRGQGNWLYKRKSSAFQYNKQKWGETTGSFLHKTINIESDISGTIDWCVFKNEKLLFKSSGGIDGTYNRTYEGSGVTYSTHADNPLSYSTNYTYSPTTFYTEKSHVLDVDLRTDSVIAEKRRATHAPTEPVLENLTGSEADKSTYGAELRFLGRTKDNDYLIGTIHGLSVVDTQLTDNEFSSGESVSEWRAQAIAHAFMPQFYQQNDYYEAYAIPQLLTFGSGWYAYQTSRYWYNDFFDSNPIVMSEASLQSRFNNVIACFSDQSFRSDQLFRSEREPKYAFAASFFGTPFPIESSFRGDLVSKGKTVGEEFNFAPIYAF